MLAKLKAAWERSWTVGWAGAKALAGLAVLAIDGAADLLADTNVQGALHQYVPDAKWGLVLIGIAAVTYISAQHRGKGAAA